MKYPHDNTYYILWEYAVDPGRLSEFETLYGPEGDWIKLFRKSDQYLGTELLKRAGVKNTYHTIDKWTSKDAYEYFLSRVQTEYHDLDKKGEDLTLSEQKIGTYQILQDIIK